MTTNSNEISNQENLADIWKLMHACIIQYVYVE